MTQNQVDTRSHAVCEMAESWPMIDALVGGTGAMRKAGKAFLPQFPAEPDASYKARLSCATLFPAFSRTAEVLAAKPLSKPIDLDGCDQLEDLFDDIDREGSTLHGYASNLMLNCMQYGLVGVLVDVPPRPEGVRTMADERDAGIRPYLATYKASSILGWREGSGGLTQLRLLECVCEEDGEFGEKMVKQVRVLTPGAWAIYRKVKDAAGNETWQIYEDGTSALGKIPFVFFYGIKDRLGVGRPPLLDLAYQNVAHWQSSSDQQNILHVARVPILFATGFSDADELVVGANAFVRTTSENAKIGFAEHSGAAIGAGEASINKLEDQMRQTGAELLVQRPNLKTATQTLSETEGNRSILQRITENFEESLEECLKLMGEWMGLSLDPEVHLFKDYGAQNISDQSTNSLISAEAAGCVSKETVFESLQRRDIISQELTWEDELERIANQPKPDVAERPQNGGVANTQSEDDDTSEAENEME